MGTQINSAGSLQTHQHAAHIPRRGHYHGSNLTRSSFKWLLLLQTPLARICYTDLTPPVLTLGLFLPLLSNRTETSPRLNSASFKGSHHNMAVREENLTPLSLSAYSEPLCRALQICKLPLMPLVVRFLMTHPQSPAQVDAAAVSGPSIWKPLIYLIETLLLHTSDGI